MVPTHERIRRRQWLADGPVLRQGRVLPGVRQHDIAFSIILMIFLVIAIIIAFGIGGNDETFAGVYGSRILNI